KRRVLTWIPLASLRSIEYDAKKETVTVRVATSDKEADDVVLEGVTGYVGTNIVGIEAMTDLGELGQAKVLFQGGVSRGVQSLRFSAPKPMEPVPAGRAAAVKQASKNQPGFTAVDLQPLYVVPGGALQTSPHLYFQETVKLDLAKVEKLTQIGSGGGNFDVLLKGGQQNPLVLIDRPRAPDGKSEWQLEGLVGRFPGGYRLFPMTTIGELRFEDKGKGD